MNKLAKSQQNDEFGNTHPKKDTLPTTHSGEKDILTHTCKKYEI